MTELGMSPTTDGGVVSMTYPNGNVLTYNYTASIDVAISRPTSLSDSTGTLESLHYLGLGTVVVRAHPQPGVDLTYIKQSGEGNGDAADQYTGLDRFGRIVDQRWRKTSDGTHTDRFKYGYDRIGNRLYRENLVDAVFSELYHANGAANGYDSLDQLLEFRRGTLSDTNSDLIPDTVTTASRSQVWTLDGQGNFTTLTTDGSPQNRTHNKQNQVTVVGGNNLAFDANGNLKTDETGKQLFFDGWNRLVEVKNSGGSTLATYKYDALYRRTIETVSGTARDLYYSTGWQVLEERDGANVKAQNVWSVVYVDALILRDRDADGNQGNGLEERLYVQQDANFNVTAIVNTTGQAVERYIYDSFGKLTYLAADWTNRSSSQFAWVYQFQGLRHSADLALSDARYRALHVGLGRFTQPDPLGFAAHDLNFYRLEDNRPTTITDPLGLLDTSVGIVVGGGVGGSILLPGLAIGLPILIIIGDVLAPVEPVDPIVREIDRLARIVACERAVREIETGLGRSRGPIGDIIRFPFDRDIDVNPPRRPPPRRPRGDCFCWITLDNRVQQYFGHITTSECQALAELMRALSPDNRVSIRWDCTAGRRIRPPRLWPGDW
jgi:RHS repeat-associated protein